MTVADDAKVTFYTAYRPDGREGEIVGIAKTGGATSTETMGSFTVSPDNMLAQFLSHNAVRANTLDDWMERVCRSVEDDHEHDRCRRKNDYFGFYFEGIPATRQTDCYVERAIVYSIKQRYHKNVWLLSLVDIWSEKLEKTSCPTPNEE